MKKLRDFEDSDEKFPFLRDIDTVFDKSVEEIMEEQPTTKNNKKEHTINLLPVVGLILIALAAAIIYWYKNVYLPKQNKE